MDARFVLGVLVGLAALASVASAQCAPTRENPNAPCQHFSQCVYNGTGHCCSCPYGYMGVNCGDPAPLQTVFCTYCSQAGRGGRALQYCLCSDGIIRLDCSLARAHLFESQFRQACPGLLRGGGGGGGSTCFDGDQLVWLEGGGSTLVRHLRPGLRILTLDSSTMTSSYQPVTSLAEFRPDSDTSYVEVVTQAGHAVLMSGNHYIFTGDDVDSLKAVPARTIGMGDTVWVLRGASGTEGHSPVMAHHDNYSHGTDPDMIQSRVIRVSQVKRKGAYNFHTTTGTAVVGSVLVSSYVDTAGPGVVHLGLWPVRLLARWTLDTPGPESGTTGQSGEGGGHAPGPVYCWLRDNVVHAAWAKPVLRALDAWLLHASWSLI